MLSQLPKNKCRNTRNKSEKDTVTPQKKGSNSSTLKCQDKKADEESEEAWENGHRITQKHKESNYSD